MHRPAALRLPPWRYAPLARPPSSRRTTPAPPRRIFRIGREKSIVQRAPNNFGKTHGALASSPAAGAAADGQAHRLSLCNVAEPNNTRCHLATVLSLTSIRLCNISDIINVLLSRLDKKRITYTYLKQHHFYRYQKAEDYTISTCMCIL